MRRIASLIASSEIGYVGEWHADYTSWRIRGTGQVGTFFGISDERMSQSVPLDLLDVAYLPEDLEMVRRNRIDLVGTGGPRCLQFKLTSPETGRLIDAHCFMNANVDRYGCLRESRGVLFASPTFEDTHEVRGGIPAHELALKHLTMAAKAVERLGFAHLKSVLQVVFKEVAQDALRKHLPRH